MYTLMIKSGFFYYLNLGLISKVGMASLRIAFSLGFLIPEVTLDAIVLIWLTNSYFYKLEIEIFFS